MWLPLEAVARSQEHRQEATATSEWSVTTKKCHAAGIMVRRGLYFTCAQSMWANLLERQLGISSRTDDEINWGGGGWLKYQSQDGVDCMLFKHIERSLTGLTNARRPF